MKSWEKNKREKDRDDKTRHRFIKDELADRAPWRKFKSRENKHSKIEGQTRTFRLAKKRGNRGGGKKRRDRARQSAGKSDERLGRITVRGLGATYGSQKKECIVETAKKSNNTFRSRRLRVERRRKRNQEWSGGKRGERRKKNKKMAVLGAENWGGKTL